MGFKSKFRELRKGAEHQPYAEWCALFTSGSLSDDEFSELRAHLQHCESCAELLRAYLAAAKSAMPLVAPEHVEPAQGQKPWSVENAKKQLFNRIEAAKAAERPQLVGAASLAPAHRMAAFEKLAHRSFTDRSQMLLGTAAVVALLAALTVFAYRMGEVRGVQSARKAPPATLVESRQPQPMQAIADQHLLEQQVQEQSREVHRLEQELKSQMEANSDSRKLLHDTREQSSTIAALSSDKVGLAQERDALARKLQETQDALVTAQERLAVLQEEQTRQLVRTASLQHRVDELSTELRESQQEAPPPPEAALSSDNDIRELMGARELYIADVFDVDRYGKPQKAFGRVFYTGGKSLIFYAFDLDRQPGVREASTFQAWGRRGPGDKHPLSMGAFSLDNVANRRWILRFDNPKVLAQLDAVFVTVEPKNGGHKPSGKQLLFASLRIPANHP
jgi:hypothetical protein